MKCIQATSFVCIMVVLLSRELTVISASGISPEQNGTLGFLSNSRTPPVSET
jgi:hypothetical protein